MESFAPAEAIVVYENINNNVETLLLKPETVKQIQVVEITHTPLSEQVLAEIGVSELSELFVRTDRSKSNTDDSVQTRVAETMDGRNTRHQFENLILVPKIISVGDNKIVFSDTEMIPFAGIDSKGGGLTKSFFETFRGRNRVVWSGDPELSQKDIPFLQGDAGHSVWGGELFNQQEEEYDQLLKLAARGARVDYPVAVAKIDDDIAPSKNMGIICRLYRTPYNMETMIKKGNKNPEVHTYLMKEALKVWEKEGLISKSELEPENLTNFYFIKGAEIAGRNLAIIHQERSLGNRNDQNMGNDFSHRDISDGKVIEYSERITKGFREMTDEVRRKIEVNINKLKEPISKLDDIYGDLQTVKHLVESQDLSNVPELSSRSDRIKYLRRGDSLSKKMMPEIINTYLKNYLRQEKGLTKRELGNLLLLGANTEMFNSIVPPTDLGNKNGIMGILFREYRKIVLEQS